MHPGQRTHPVEKPRPVGVRNEPIIEDAERLMSPQQHQIGRLLECRGVRQRNTLDHPGDVAK
eukprot:4993135-Prymnesium_polylepis.1